MKIKSLACKTSTDLGLLIIRVAAGLAMAFSHGLGKLPPSERFIEGVTSLGFPLPVFFAWCATGAEFLGGLLIAIGLFTRPAAAMLAFTMAVAFFGVHGSDPFGQKELPFLYLVIAISIFFSGAGKYSVGALFCKKK